jgi:hypothetical protein
MIQALIVLWTLKRSREGKLKLLTWSWSFKNLPKLVNEKQSIKLQ